MTWWMEGTVVFVNNNDDDDDDDRGAMWTVDYHGDGAVDDSEGSEDGVCFWATVGPPAFFLGPWRREAWGERLLPGVFSTLHYTREMA